VSLLAAAFLFAYAPPWGTAANEPFIDTAAPIQPKQCAPCHLDISDVDVDGLIFSHGNHLLVACEGCHYRMPHRGDVTERVPMDACFACHGVNHGMQGELATGRCEDCHTRPDELRPVSHGLTWAKEPHAEVSLESGVNRCMMCHDSIRDCDTCHAKEVPDVPEMPLAYHSMVTPLDKGPSVRIYTRGPVSMSQCLFCHSRIDDSSAERLVFAHADHIQRNYRCEACHPRFPHTALGLERPDMMSCYRCHGLNHNSQGQVATEKCEACHPVSFELMPDDHTRAFIKGEHKERANEDAAYCAMCHKSESCTGCHRGKKVSPNAPGKQIIPVAHREVKWQEEHGALFLASEGSCNSCHDDASCKRCHQTVMPHPVGWMEDHSPEPGVSGEDCGVCHTNRATCQNCHHQRVKGENLIARNCTPCHDEMKTAPATRIKHKKFAEHAVHFEARTLDDRPYRCDDCHYGFGRTHIPMPGTAGLPEATHELRLCYSCHGALDLRNRRIAPYRGRELCVRCHTDLRV
jgi:hypothetical protein